MSTHLLNRTTAPQCIQLFDACFKQGVLDAHDYGDDIDTKAFLDSKREDWTFGILGKDHDADWHAFQFYLYWICRKRRLGGLADNYVFKVRRKDYTWCLFAYCMRFYLLGISEWLEYPSQVNIQVFKGQTRIHWSPKAEMTKFTRGDYFSYLHDFGYAYQKLNDELKPVSRAMMDGFCAALFDLSKKY